MADREYRPNHESWFSNYLNNFLRFIAIVALLVIATLVYRYLLEDIITGRSHFLAFVALWILTAYIVLPRVYRGVSKIFVPNYFIGRTQTGDGLLGDPINIAFNGDRAELVAAMQSAGWSLAEPLNLNSSLKMIYHSIRGSRYPTAPVSSLFVFGRRQDLAYEKEVDGNPRKRHHIRFWETPKDWWLPGGYQTDWLAAATFDSNVSLSLFTGQITHKIDADVDQERDFVISTLKDAKATSEVNFVKHFTSSYHSRNGGGDDIHTDGALPFVTLKAYTNKASRSR
jgi:hypothetical protein